uniref:Bm10470 n=1 Tax=Brugia malayi TaxID=6279 RepID=A0A1I9G6W7_BRUMA|nr:Bm10470 [Brugia malayi]
MAKRRLVKKSVHVCYKCVGGLKCCKTWATLGDADKSMYPRSTGGERCHFIEDNITIIFHSEDIISPVHRSKEYGLNACTRTVTLSLVMQ